MHVVGNIVTSSWPSAQSSASPLLMTHESEPKACLLGAHASIACAAVGIKREYCAMCITAAAAPTFNSDGTATKRVMDQV